MLEPRRFREHVEILTRRGDRFVALAESVEHLDDRRAPPDGTCALTFDDGTRADPSSAGVEEAYREMASSTRALEELLQVPVVSFACPKLLFLGSVPRGSGSRGLPGGRDMCRAGRAGSPTSSPARASRRSTARSAL